MHRGSNSGRDRGREGERGHSSTNTSPRKSSLYRSVRSERDYEENADHSHADRDGGDFERAERHAAHHRAAAAVAGGAAALAVAAALATPSRGSSKVRGSDRDRDRDRDHDRYRESERERRSSRRSSGQHSSRPATADCPPPLTSATASPSSPSTTTTATAATEHTFVASGRKFFDVKAASTVEPNFALRDGNVPSNTNSIANPDNTAAAPAQVPVMVPVPVSFPVSYSYLTPEPQTPSTFITTEDIRDKREFKEHRRGSNRRVDKDCDGVDSRDRRVDKSFVEAPAATFSSDRYDPSLKRSSTTRSRFGSNMRFEDAGLIGQTAMPIEAVTAATTTTTATPSRSRTHASKRPSTRESFSPPHEKTPHGRNHDYGKHSHGHRKRRQSNEGGRSTISPPPSPSREVSKLLESTKVQPVGPMATTLNTMPTSSSGTPGLYSPSVEGRHRKVRQEKRDKAKSGAEKKHGLRAIFKKYLSAND